MTSGKNNPIATGPDVTALIPQRPPFVMIDKLFFADKVKTVTGLTIGKDCILCDNGSFSESGLVENIAQTAAAGIGFVCMQENRDVPLGFIAAIKDLAVHHLPPAGAEITTETVVRNEVMGITLVSGKVFCNSILQAECEMRIFIKQE